MSANKIGSPKKYTVADVYKAAGKMIGDEMKTLKGEELNKTEKTKSDKLAKLLSNSVLKEMNIV